ncbi:MAG: HlyD family efflux transporter periplasmic adaptor subunit, partial [Deltaproteobacteria bacterium]
EGDAVEPGMALARLDDALERLERDARAAEARAVRAELALLQAGSRPEDIRAVRAQRSEVRARLRLAEQDLARIERLFDKGAATQADLDGAKAQVATLRAQLRHVDEQLARLHSGARPQEIEAAEARAEAAETAVRAADERIARHVLRADAAGLVLDRFVEPGEFAAMGTPVVTVADVTRPYVDVFVPEGRMDEVALGAAAEVHVDAYDAPFDGAVEHVGRRTEYTPHYLFSPRERPFLVLRVRVRIDDPEGRLHAGLPAFVTFRRDGSP